jgi:hypothetical protein
MAKEAYTPKEGTDVHWFLMDGSGHTVTKFHDNGIPRQITIPWMKERYGDPSKDDKHPFSQYRFGLDPLKGVLPGAIRVASEQPDSGVTMPKDQMVAYVQAYDIAATLTEDGEKSPFVQKYQVTGAVGAWPNRPGDSTDPKFRTERRIMGPHGNFERVGIDGKTYYYFNPRADRPGDPWYRDPAPPVTAPLPRPEPTPTTAPEVSREARLGESGPTGSGVRRDELQRLLEAADRVKLAPEGGGEPARALRTLREGLRQLLNE